ncbi:MAG: UDP-3-O-[3-hydroxymyristoyl] N-acetylglucosamine deacetylase [Candidatus Scalindua sp.]|nr:UDP-3-O-[3-hydroxymyristoyl] N-acetylglucosamine deacetylase [Candidatus Scalindua sp.]MBT5304577.1 UDP-3-O-[3-hydroxymyristoyl] N-acetylglucosamine deacetylase [Candidatus Scalindua sp.]MBT6045466.1 UDP-3-O-[3-hydroxymyristoyl] N-acetylglucosamine deacetylase [Candidatus Scalindua sp.]MBT6226250.1 UDP-3-O-[3-hydroxymyristoyl] N-acetylglucosamine deacetylase [Candidatus Scalindua sp.]MBT6561294.1 UDP-3-O-[3-hydroxymyristoyl] N-acetylglucosamine deacetylase [Candidatus Scalindua sp.]
MDNLQRTISRVVEYSGIGLFTGVEVKLRFKPALANTGIVFVRTDVEGHPKVPANIEMLYDTKRLVTLEKDGVGVKSVEHVMAAFSGLGIDNIEIEVNSNEVPAGDGSSLLFLQLLKGTGIKTLAEPKNTYYLQEELRVSNGDASMIALPYDKGLSLSYILDFNGSFLNRQCFEIEMTEDNFSTQIAPARTFGLCTVIEEYKKLGLGKGVTDDNSLILQEDGSITKPLSMSPAELRFPNECVRHKILDIIGDLYLTNLTLHARIVATKSGHYLNTCMAEKIYESAKKYAHK